MSPRKRPRYHQFCNFIYHLIHSANIQISILHNNRFQKLWFEVLRVKIRVTKKKLAFNKNDLKTPFMKTYQIFFLGIYLLIFCGCALVFVGLLGCWGSIKENRILLYVVSFFKRQYALILFRKDTFILERM